MIYNPVTLYFEEQQVILLASGGKIGPTFTKSR